MAMTNVRARPDEEAGLINILPHLKEDVTTADAKFILRDKSLVPVHKCFLSASPVLKDILTSLDSRLDKVPHISMAEFDSEVVNCLVQFLYKGFVVLQQKTIAKEFFSLCKILRLNPPINAGEGIEAKPVSVPDVNSTETSDHDLEDSEEVNVPDKDEETELKLDDSSDALQDNLSNCIDVIEDKIDDGSDLESTVNDVPEKNTNTSLISPAPEEMSISLEVEKGEEREDLENIFDPVEQEELRKEYNTNDAVGIHHDTVDQMEGVEDSMDVPMYEPPSFYDDGSEEETPEQISSYLNLLNNLEDNRSVPEESNPGDDNTFKMPDSFDLPQDFIKEISSNVNEAPINLSKSPYHISDEEPSTKVSTESPADDEIDVKVLEVVESNTSEDHAKNHNLDAKDDSVQKGEKPKTLPSDSVEQITYKKNETSIRYKSDKKRTSRLFDPRKDRRNVNSSLFGSDSDTDQKKIGNRVNDSKESSPDENRTPTPTTSLKDDLAEKRERMRKKLKTGPDDVVVQEYKMPKKKRLRHNSTENVGGAAQVALKKHTCHSSCPCVKKLRTEQDDKFVVSDSHVTSNSDSEEGDSRKRIKLTKKSPKKSAKIDDDASDDSDDDAEDRRKRLDERKAKMGGDILSWMNPRGNVKVTVQDSPKAVIKDMALYKLQMLADEDSQDSDTTVNDVRNQSDTDTDDSIPKGRRIVSLKESSEESSDHRVKEKKKKLKKSKKRKKEKRSVEREREPSDTEEPAEEIVWTPQMYKEWDKRKHKKGDSDSDKDRIRKMKRSLSQPSPPFRPKSHSSQDLGGSSYSKFSPSKGASTGFNNKVIDIPRLAHLPKIPKLKKE